MELVFDGPVGANEFKQPFGPSLVWGKTGDQIDDFGARFIADEPGAFEAGDLSETWPVEMGHGFGADSNLARFDAAMSFFERFRNREIRRRSVVTTPCVQGGKDRRTLWRCQLSGWIDCL